MDNSNVRNPPVVINTNRVTPSITRDAFYALGFISENNVAERHTVVKSLDEFPDNGYERNSPAFIACRQALSQEGGMNEITLIAKRPSETHYQAIRESKYNTYYYLATDIEDVNTFVNFSNDLLTADITKLLFFSSEIDVTEQLKGLKNVVWWYSIKAWKWDNYFSLQWDDYDLVDFFETTMADDTWGWDSEIDNGWDSDNPVYRYDFDYDARIAYDYDYISWISLCGRQFPTDMNWYNKKLNDVDIEYDAPELANFYGEAFDDEVTIGSGTTCEPMWIDHKVLDDWIRWAIQRNVWKLIKTSRKISGTKSGLEQINTKIKEVLEFLYNRGAILSYSTVLGDVDGARRTAKNFTFEYTRVDMINGVVSVDGVVTP